MTFFPEGQNIFVSPSTRFGKNVRVGHCSFVGSADNKGQPVHIGDDVTIGAFCLVAPGAELGNGSSIDDYCKIGPAAIVGPGTRILYGSHLYDEVDIGANCIIGGHVADRTIIEDDVTYFGEIAHSHRDPNLDWDETEEDSPVIYRGTVVGVNAIIIGGRKIGPGAYIGAGEIVRTDVGEGMILIDGEIHPLSKFRGIIKARC